MEHTEKGIDIINLDLTAGFPDRTYRSPDLWITALESRLKVSHGKQIIKLFQASAQISQVSPGPNAYDLLQYETVPSV